MSGGTPKVGVVGCGNISGAYLGNSKQYPAFEITACADIDPARAKAKAEEFGVEACTVDDLLADPEIDTVLNLTIPKAHFDIAKAALAAGKHAYNEKPLAIAREEGRALVGLAERKGLRLGCAPDTFLGAGLQTCRKLIDDGAIGEPVGATAFMVGRGPEGWHPDPETFYKKGAGPVFDMGPYYITALVSLLGPVKRVASAAKISFPERVIGSAPRRGQKIAVEVPTFVAGLLDFASGAVGNIVMSFDVWAARLPIIEIYGSEGSIAVPDPNGFGGPVRLRKSTDGDWGEAALTHPENRRSVGLADMLTAAASGRPHRASGRLALHALDVMHALHDAGPAGRYLDLETTCDRPEPMPLGLADGEVPA